jgi:F0F1-type ATP synthase membrane subunit c/vacuolar-type H+-ATPase subunit K
MRKEEDTGYDAANKTSSEDATLNLLWKILVGSVCVYGALGYVFAEEGRPGAANENVSFLVTVFAGISAAMMVAVFSRGQLLTQRLNYFTYCIVRWAMAEAIGVFGLVLAFLGATKLVVLSFCGWSLLSLFRLRPTTDDFNRFRRLRG